MNSDDRYVVISADCHAGGEIHEYRDYLASKYHDEFDAWFQYEHMPMLLEEPTWYGCTFYRALGGSRYAFGALHNLEPQALTSDARNRSVDTPWWHRLTKHAWFDKEFVRARLTEI